MRPASRGPRIGRLFQADAGLDGEDHQRHLLRRERRRLACPPVHLGDDPGQALPGTGVQRRVPPGQLRVTRRVDAELDQQQPPVQLGTVAPGRVLAQHPHPLRAAQPLGQPRVLRRTPGDPFLQQGQEQVGLVAEPGLHHARGRIRPRRRSHPAWRRGSRGPGRSAGRRPGPGPGCARSARHGSDVSYDLHLNEIFIESQVSSSRDEHLRLSARPPCRCGNPAPVSGYAAGGHQAVLPVAPPSRRRNTQPMHAVAAAVRIEDPGLARTAPADLRLDLVPRAPAFATAYWLDRSMTPACPSSSARQRTTPKTLSPTHSRHCPESRRGPSRPARHTPAPEPASPLPSLITGAQPTDCSSDQPALRV